jgi:ADP-ribosylglycohydrolase
MQSLKVYKTVQDYNINSQSNGCLMRISPQIVWGRNLSDDDFYHAIKLQSFLTHSNPDAIEATFLYCWAIK